MPLSHSTQLLFLLLFWAVMIPVAIVILRQTCVTFGEFMPSKWRSFFMIILIAPIGYLVYDFSGYIIALTMNDTVLHLPPGYSYRNWAQEPFSLKWQVLSTVPMVRFLPIVFGVCVAGILQVFFLEEVPFRKAVLMLVVQWGCTMVALVLVGYVFGFLVHTFAGRIDHEMPRLTQAAAEAREFAGIHLKEQLPEGHSLVDFAIGFLKAGGWMILVGLLVLLWFVPRLAKRVRKLRKKSLAAKRAGS